MGRLFFSEISQDEKQMQDFLYKFNLRVILTLAKRKGLLTEEKIEIIEKKTEKLKLQPIQKPFQQPRQIIRKIPQIRHQMPVYNRGLQVPEPSIMVPLPNSNNYVDLEEIKKRYGDFLAPQSPTSPFIRQQIQQPVQQPQQFMGLQVPVPEQQFQFQQQPQQNIMQSQSMQSNQEQFAYSDYQPSKFSQEHDFSYIEQDLKPKIEKIQKTETIESKVPVIEKPASEKKEFGKISNYLLDSNVNEINIQSGRNIIIDGKEMNNSLSEDEIKELINKFGEKTSTPVNDVVFSAVYDKFRINAVNSESGNSILRIKRI
ncbi:hypothetical protein CO154_01960 [Candidatus Pacearchaeota archaeon CG_4_9_14_3_um_filter_31_7]|nr:MAG: hypothetical protein AUJ10_01520 [Candidatus Pacearchaeota archaeon CG1_02_31_27]PIN92642.1 MAG: hypothetical protein COU55_00505 [Candidatus Pacearchaeota archaeon CG10_big_fil_rev_8_21_14_0_10_31_59]PIZ81175.1 MAG: hypothetical protein COX99_00295 [Candidatus Pacearchaeota archaeon CG_4_10_14_0_2_um_filter_31_10]PJA70610.1 MAG: hypothetical protein CO154_01960 [Candidatus Pacearchaeota archaeon CG_4_9_14_3_um_filter_31_7]